MIRENNDFDIKKKIVLEDGSKLFKNWHEVANISKQEFIDALKWVCDDPLDDKGRLTREIGLVVTKDAEIKYRVAHDPEGAKMWFGYTKDSYDEDKTQGHIVKLSRKYDPRIDIVMYFDIETHKMWDVTNKVMINCRDHI